MPRIEFLRQLRNFPFLLIYNLAVISLNLKKNIIAFTHAMPEKPMKIYLLNPHGEIIRVIKRKIYGYNAKEQFEIIRSHRTEKNYTLKKIQTINFTKEDYLIVQWKNEFYKNGKFKRFECLLDIFDSEGNLIKKEMKFEGDILSIDKNNNIYVRTEDEQGIPKVVVYSLMIEK